MKFIIKITKHIIVPTSKITMSPVGISTFQKLACVTQIAEQE